MKAINVLRKVKVEGVWKLLPVAKSEDKIDWGHLLFRGGLMVATSGTFYLEWREGGKRIRRSVGDHQRQAKAALASQLSVLTLRDRGMDVEDAPEINPKRHLEGRTIAQVVNEFLSDPPLNLRQRSRAKYANALKSFQSWTRKTHLCQLDREDIRGFMSYLVTVENLERGTAVDKGHIVHGVMNERGAAIVMKRGDWPKVTDTERDLYEPETLQRLFAACDLKELALFQTFLLTGFREQEVAFLSWDDFNARTRTLRVSRKSELGFEPKNYQERTNYIPKILVDLLIKHRHMQGDSEFLIFPTSRHNVMQGRPGGQRDRHMLDLLKRIALRADLNCGRCTGTWRTQKSLSCKDAPVCKRFGLHMFRHTYATTLLQDGVDLISLQSLMGHSDLESTQKYLRALRPEAMKAKIDSTSLSSKFFQPQSQQNSSPVSA